MIMEHVANVVIISVICGAAVMGGVIGNIMGWRSGRKIGRIEGHAEYVRKLKFERREEMPLINPTDQPHSRRPKGRARVTEAHMSQPRRSWMERGDS